MYPLVRRRLLDCDVVEALGGPSRRSLDRVGNWDAVDLLEHGAALDRVGMEACRYRTGTGWQGAVEVKFGHCPLLVMFDFILSRPMDPAILQSLLVLRSQIRLG